ncbi:Bax inhibitor-1/YccA family protein [Novosphingobium mangrovi (ex Hu et al. 2023)]|uniref:Bax inhibitor-1/YccA family protein n=1 Tax=Novosphingobium mangrovi (ex Hu et al. 2023) TaxID=2930094 RepID=A0ABT0A8C3_9SPHN|nr:Bax inhibitor-1/YccA family protein [Novosphingobium mangrovi (ex Hu et al. 2023)]MCJ1959449.1 Bax inhibitor-1/YccA family protein [Novosphingobium mangrovi (ex Hu et al. 2023)]
MANWNDPQPRQGFGASPIDGRTAGRATYDAGLRKYMLSIYNYMASGVLLTGIVAMLFASSGLAYSVLTTPLRWVVMLAPFGFVLAMSFGLNKMKTSTLQILYWGFAVVMGLSLSSVFLVYTGESIATTFFATAAGFAGLSLFGYTTKKDLSGFGRFLIMGLVGILVAMLINLFVQSSALHMAISILGVLIFAGLTAYDTQKLKMQYQSLQGTEFLGKAVIMGALTLYLDFINMFLFLLNFLGQRD